MHLVIDSNQLQTDRLRRFFQQSRQNRAVLTDFLGMEGYNGDKKSYFRWLEVLAEFPDQVIVLKGSAEVMRLSGRPSGLLRRMIDVRATKDFAPQHLETVRVAKAGDEDSLAQVGELRRFASEHLAKMETEAADIRNSMDVLGGMYSNEERALIRERKPYTEAMLEKLTQNLFSIVATMLGTSERGRSFDRDIKNTLAFRVALAMYVLMLHRTAAGSISEMSPGRLKNDFVDMILVAYGTFFDGVLTADVRLKDLYDEVAILLFGLYGAFIADGCNPFTPSLP